MREIGRREEWGYVKSKEMVKLAGQHPLTFPFGVRVRRWNQDTGIKRKREAKTKTKRKEMKKKRGKEKGKAKIYLTLNNEKTTSRQIPNHDPTPSPNHNSIHPLHPTYQFIRARYPTNAIHSTTVLHHYIFTNSMTNPPVSHSQAVVHRWASLMLKKDLAGCLETTHRIQIGRAQSRTHPTI